MDYTEFKAACQAVMTQANTVRQVVLDHRQDIWGFMPSIDDQTNEVAKTRRVAQTPLPEDVFIQLADKLTDLWMGDRVNRPVGLLVCDIPQVLEQVHRMNTFKLSLCSQIDALKKQLFVSKEQEVNPHANDDFLDAMAVARSEFVNKNRDHAFQEIVRRLGLAEIDFSKARKRIRLLPETTQHVGYSWAKNHSRVRTIAPKTLQALAQHYRRNGEDARSQAILDGLDMYAGQKLYRVHFNKPTVRINYKYMIESTGELKWASCLGAGVTIAPTAHNPNVAWTPRPSEAMSKLVQDNWLTTSRLVEVNFAPGMCVFVKG
ncbi:hypothetical protein [Thiomicrospira microaerophila]|uniref:hypothetical protein n=1 Tax=Thiomicrospira microaerophila TaxID=406020 RepID=UPI0005CAFEEC|nr:hypothetical protein [Thiomicrospira microaerophila]